MAPVSNRQDSRTRAEEAHRLRAVGRTWQEIADTLGYRTRAGAIQAVQRLMDRTPPETPKAARLKADEALRITQSILFGRLAVAVRDHDDDLVARYAKEIRSTVTERAKLVGAYAPAQAVVDVRVEQSVTAVIDRAEAELLALLPGQPHQAVLPILDAEVLPVEATA